MMSVFTAPAIVIVPIAGILADRYGRKVVLVSSVTLFGLGGSAIIFTTVFRVVLLFRLVQGVGYAGINPILITSIGDLYSGGEEETAQGLRFTASGLSGAVFPLIAGVLVGFAWQYPFAMYAMAFPIALGVYLWLNEPSEAVQAKNTQNCETTPYRQQLYSLSRQPRVLSMVVARGLMVTVFIGFLTYNSLIVVRLLDGTPALAGILAAVVFFTFAVTASQAGRITASVEGGFYPLLGANIAVSLGFAVVLLASEVLTAVVGILGIGVGFGLLGSLYRSIISGLAPVSLRGGLVSIAEAVGQLSSTLTPLFMGVIIGVASPTLGFASALQLAGLTVTILGGAGGIVCLLVAKASPQVTVESPDSSTR